MKKTGYFFFSFLPFLATIFLQFIISIPIMGISLLQICIKSSISGTKMGFIEFITKLESMWTDTNFTLLISVCYAASVIILFGFWLTQQFHISLFQSPAKVFHPYYVLGMICFVPALQTTTSIITSLTAQLFPGWMDYYEALIEAAGLTQSPSILLVLYAVLLGPIAEEITFRGLVFSSAKKALPFWAANLFQAILFGIFHLNVIQGIYAFFVGLCLGYVCQKGGSIYISILLHILFNAWGTFFPAGASFFSTPVGSITLFILSFAFGIIGIYLFRTGLDQRNMDK